MKRFPGLGLLEGLAVTGKNMVESFYKKERMTTVQYPEQKKPMREQIYDVFDRWRGANPWIGDRSDHSLAVSGTRRTWMRVGALALPVAFVLTFATKRWSQAHRANKSSLPRPTTCASS